MTLYFIKNIIKSPITHRTPLKFALIGYYTKIYIIYHNSNISCGLLTLWA